MQLDYVLPPFNLVGISCAGNIIDDEGAAELGRGLGLLQGVRHIEVNLKCTLAYISEGLEWCLGGTIETA